MTNSAQYILQHLFGEGRLEDVSVDQLRQLVDEYPSFNVGHYLLSIKLQKEKDEDYLPETQKTALYFHNPLWLQWLLQTTEEKPLAHLEEIAAALRMNDAVYREQSSSETAMFTTEEIKDDYYSTTKTEEPAEKIYSADITNEESPRENFIIENPVLERYAEPINEEYRAPEIRHEQINDEVHIENKPEEKFETYNSENPVFEENAK